MLRAVGKMKNESRVSRYDTPVSSGNSAAGDDVGSMESSAGLAMSLRSIPTGGGVGGQDMVQWFGVLM